MALCICWYWEDRRHPCFGQIGAASSDLGWLMIEKREGERVIMAVFDFCFNRCCPVFFAFPSFSKPMSIISILTNEETEMNQIIIEIFLLSEKNKGLFCPVFLFFFYPHFPGWPIYFSCGFWTNTVILCDYLIFHYKRCISYSVQFKLKAVAALSKMLKCALTKTLQTSAVTNRG